MAAQYKRPMTIRGLQEMRTSAGAIGTASNAATMPHKLHMRLCSLEMERYRREQERRVAMERADKCEARCRAIESEVRTLLAAINAQNTMHTVEPKTIVGPRGATRGAASGGTGPGAGAGTKRPPRMTHLY